MNKTETELLAACIQGDRASQELLYKQFFGFAMGICLRYVHSKETAIEVVHDSFMKVFLKYNQFNDDSNFKAWFKKIVINSSIDYIRKEKKYLLNQDITEVDDLHTAASAISSFNHQDLMKLVYALPPAYKLAFSMYAIDGYSHLEIADALGITVGTSKSNLSRAREILRKKIEKEMSFSAKELANKK